MSLDQEANFNLGLFDLMTPSQKRIALAYLSFYERQIINQEKESFPSIATIASMAKCCRRTVDTFIKQFEKLVFTHTNRRYAVINEFQSNVYSYNHYFFEHLILLKCHQYLYRWNQVRIAVMKKVMDNANFLYEKFVKNPNLSTDELRTGYTRKLRTINSYINSFKKMSVPNPKVHQQIKEIKERKGFGVLQGSPLTFAEKEKLSLLYAPIDLQTALENYNYFSKKERVRYNYCFFQAKAKENALKRLQKYK